MKKLSSNNYSTVLPFFHPNYINAPLIYAIIEHKIPGQIWVDTENAPTNCLVISNGPYCYMGGVLNDESLAQYINILKEKGFIKVAFEGNAQLNLSPFGFVPVARRQYRYKDIHARLPSYPNHTAFILKKIEEATTFQACIWYDFMLSLYGSIENYLHHGLGFVLWDTQNQRIASETHGILSHTLVEVATITHENYRNQNLSTILCNHFLKYAIAQGLHPTWSCDETNPASWRVAQKQGMDDESQYTFYTLNA